MNRQPLRSSLRIRPLHRFAFAMLAAVMLVGSHTATAQPPESAASRPNIIFIMADEIYETARLDGFFRCFPLLS